MDDRSAGEGTITPIGRIKLLYYISSFLKANRLLTLWKKSVFDFQGNIIRGSLFSKTATRLIREWIDLHSAELEADWKLAKAGKQIRKIDPLT